MKRNDEIIKVDEGDVTGVFVPFLLVNGLPGPFFDEAIARADVSCPLPHNISAWILTPAQNPQHEA